MVMSGQSVRLTTLFFLGKLDLAVNQYFVNILSLVTIHLESSEGKRMAVEIIS